jgi:hypothetical protein
MEVGGETPYLCRPAIERRAPEVAMPLLRRPAEPSLKRRDGGDA